MSFLPVVYYSEGSSSIGAQAPDILLTMDAPLFYFRNQKEGAGPCAAPECADFWGPSCKPPLNDSRTGGCLAKRKQRRNQGTRLSTRPPESVA